MKNLIIIVAILFSRGKAVSQSGDSLQYHVQKPIEKVLLSGAFDFTLKTSESSLILMLENGLNKLSISSTDSLILSNEHRLYTEFCKSSYWKSLKAKKIIILLKIRSYLDNYTIQYRQGNSRTIDENRIPVNEDEKVLVRTVYINIGPPVR